MIPGWWQFLLLALAAYRLWKLAAADTILDRPRARLLGAAAWRPGAGDPPETFRHRLAEFIACPWCLGAWLSSAAWVSWLLAPHVTLIAATPLAISAIVGLAGSRLD